MAQFGDRDPRCLVEGLAWPVVVQVPLPQGIAVVSHLPPSTRLPGRPGNPAKTSGINFRGGGGAEESRAHLLLLDGPPAVGKTTAQRLLGLHPRVAILPKYKTGLRKDEHGSIDGREIDTVTFHRFARSPEFYAYTFGGEGYGFFRHSLDRAMKRYSLVALVVRNSVLLSGLLREFPSASAVLILADRDVAHTRAGNTPEARQRLARADEFWRDYDFSLYTHTIVNHGSADRFSSDIQRLLSIYFTEEIYVPQPAA